MRGRTTWQVWRVPSWCDAPRTAGMVQAGAPVAVRTATGAVLVWRCGTAAVCVGLAVTLAVTAPGRLPGWYPAGYAAVVLVWVWGIARELSTVRVTAAGLVCRGWRRRVLVWEDVERFTVERYTWSTRLVAYRHDGERVVLPAPCGARGDGAGARAHFVWGATAITASWQQTRGGEPVPVWEGPAQRSPYESLRHQAAIAALAAAGATVLAAVAVGVAAAFTAFDWTTGWGTFATGNPTADGVEFALGRLFLAVPAAVWAVTLTISTRRTTNTPATATPDRPRADSANEPA